MKYVILLLMMITLAFGQDITSTQQYEALINKADSELVEAQKLRDAKVRRATVLYIKALEKKKKAVMASGDLDKANELDKEIKNLKPLLTKALVKPTKPIINIDIITTEDREKSLGYKLKRHSVGAKLGSGGHYYKFFEGFISWKDAYKKCKEMGGYLAVVTTQYEFDFLMKYTKPSEKPEAYVWLGGTMVNGNVKWITKEEQNKDLTHKQLHNRYTHCILRNSELGISSLFPTGLNGSNVKLIKGFVCEWDN